MFGKIYSLLKMTYFHIFFSYLIYISIVFLVVYVFALILIVLAIENRKILS